MPRLGGNQVEPLVSVRHLFAKGVAAGRVHAGEMARPVGSAWPCGSLIVSCQCHSHLAASGFGNGPGGSWFLTAKMAGPREEG